MSKVHFFIDPAGMSKAELRAAVDKLVDMLTEADKRIDHLERLQDADQTAWDRGYDAGKQDSKALLAVEREFGVKAGRAAALAELDTFALLSDTGVFTKAELRKLVPPEVQARLDGDAE